MGCCEYGNEPPRSKSKKKKKKKKEKKARNLSRRENVIFSRRVELLTVSCLDQLYFSVQTFVLVHEPLHYVYHML
jgi:hypothetical protein